MNMKKKVATLGLVAAMLLTSAGATLAYFTDKDDATNTFTVGNVSIDLTEPKWDEAGKVDAPEVYPGEALAKDPTVKNIGANPCFVRVKVEGLDCLGDAGNIIYRTDYVDGKLGDNWVEHNGYFYYTKVLAVGATTDALFDQIVIPTGLENPIELEGEDTNEEEYKIDVTAYAVQAQGAKPSFSAVESMTVEEIAAWFTTCGM